MKPAKTDDVMKSTSSDPSSDKRSDDDEDDDDDDDDIEEKVRPTPGLSSMSDKETMSRGSNVCR